jgi:hypothetical protein
MYGYYPMYMPPRMETTRLYPEVSSQYTTTDGEVYDVKCFVPGDVPPPEEVGNVGACCAATSLVGTSHIPTPLSGFVPFTFFGPY